MAQRFRESRSAQRLSLGSCALAPCVSNIPQIKMYSITSLEKVKGQGVTGQVNWFRARAVSECGHKLIFGGFFQYTQFSTHLDLS